MAFRRFGIYTYLRPGKHDVFSMRFIRPPLPEELETRYRHCWNQNLRSRLVSERNCGPSGFKMSYYQRNQEVA